MKLEQDSAWERAMQPNAGIVLHGDLANLRWDGDEVHAMNELDERLLNQGVDFYGKFDGDATIDDVDGLRHWTTKSGWSIFFKWANNPHQVGIYAIGRHGKTNKHYELFTHSSRGKAKLYTF